MKSKRLLALFLVVLVISFLFYRAIESPKDIDFINLGTGLGTLIIGLGAYIAGDTVRPSGTMKQDQKNIE